MNRIIVEDCYKKINNHFQLVVIASHRARQISSGFVSKLDRGNDKNPVLALREIAEGVISIDSIFKSLLNSYKFNIMVDEDQDNIDY